MSHYRHERVLKFNQLLHLIHSDFSYIRSGQFLKWAQPHVVNCPVVNSIYYQIMYSLFLKVKLIVLNTVFSSLNYPLQSGAK